MKLIILLTVIASVHATAGGFAQSITLSHKEASLETIFRDIKKQTGYNFLYRYEWLQEAKKVTVEMKGASLEEVLQVCFADQPLTYAIVDKTIVLKQKVEKEREDLPTDTLITVTGTVFNEGGQPLSGANITSKETNKGTITNAKGEFELNAISIKNTLIISYIGYSPQQTKIIKGTKIQIYLKIARNELDRVVIQAYGTTTQRLATGNIATVTAEQIERQPMMNALEALVGQVPGVIVTPTSGYASAPFKVEIRGRSVINPNLPSEPLYIIDGVPLTILETGSGNYGTGSLGITQNGFAGPASGQSPLFSINPEDVESISVLKDADATAIYGSRGANGVILITTKKGKATKPKFDISIYQGISQVTRYFHMLNTQQYINMRREALQNDSIIPDAGNAYDLLIWDTTRYTDWQKALWGGMGHTSDVQLALTGGDKQMTFHLGGNYHRETDVTTVSGSNQRASLQFNLSHQSLNQKFNLSYTSNCSYSVLDITSSPSAVTLPPNAPPIYDDQGKLNYSGWSPVSDSYLFGSLLQPYSSKTVYLNNQLSASYQFIKEFSFTTNLGYLTYHNSQVQIIPIVSQNPQYNPTGYSQFGNNNGSTIIVEPQFEYTKRISKGKINFLIGGSLQNVSQDGNNQQGSGYVNDNLLYSISNAPTQTSNNSDLQYKYNAIFSRLNYNWSNKYIVNISARRDGSSRFGPGKQFGNFGSLGIAWIFTEEKWFKKKLAFLSFGKLRSSYGVTGSDQIPNYQYLTQWTSNRVTYIQGTPAYIPLIHSNPKLQWQVIKKFEGALNLGFLKDKITMELAWYKNRCSNQLVPFVLPIFTGFNTVSANLPAVVENTGIEGTIRGELIGKKDITWTAYADFGINRNKLISYPNLSLSYYASIFEVGKPLNMTRLLHFTGVDPKTGENTFEDKNHDGSITNSYNKGNNDLYDNDLSVRFEGGIGTDFRYKGIMLNIFCSVRKNKVPGLINVFPGQISNQSAEVLNRWRKPGDIAKYARFTTVGNSNTNSDYFYQFSDAEYVDGSYFRLRNLSLSYDMPEKYRRKSGILMCRVYVRGQNLILATKYKDGDPSIPGLGGLPPARIVTVGLELGF